MMAVLLGSLSNRKRDEPLVKCVEILPPMASLDLPRDAYRVHIGPNNDGRVFDSDVDLGGYLGVHDDMVYMAQACISVETLLWLPINGIVTSSLAMTCQLAWADFIVINASSPGRPDALNISVYVYDRAEPASGNSLFTDRCTLFDFATNARAVREFGEDLLRELIAAWRRRQELGIGLEGEAEGWPEYFENDPKWSALF